MPEFGLVAAMLAGATAGVLSVPHCVAMCGPIASAACARAGHRSAPLRYQLGRVLGYAFVGMLAGQLSQVLQGLHTSAPAGWALRGLFALSCLWLARHLWRPVAGPTAGPTAGSDVPLTQLRPQPRRGARLRRGLSSLLPREPTALGALTGLLPCGALYAALLLAAGSGRADLGAALMVAFAATSGAALMATTSTLRLPSLAPGRRGARAVAALMVVLACASFVKPLTASPAPAATATEAPACH